MITRKAVFVAQTVLALPYIVALTAAAIQGLPQSLLTQARLLGAGRLQVAILVLREPGSESSPRSSPRSAPPSPKSAP